MYVISTNYCINHAESVDSLLFLVTSIVYELAILLLMVFVIGIYFYFG